MCTLYIPEEDKVVSVASEHLEPVVPQKGDRVRRTCFDYSLSVSTFPFSLCPCVSNLL